MPTHHPIPPHLSQSTLSEKQNHLKHVRDNLNILIETSYKQHSRLSHAASTWGKLPTWSKWLIGILILGGALAIGLELHWTILAVTAGIGSVIYTGCSLLLDDHYHNEKQVGSELKNTFGALSTILEDFATFAQSLCIQLSETIDRLDDEIAKLRDELQKEITQLHMQITVLHVTVEQLSMTKEELHTIQLGLTKQYKELHQANANLKQLLSVMAQQIAGTAADQAKFLNQVEQLLGDNAADTRTLLVQFHATHTQLARVKNQLQRCNQTYGHLLTEHKTLLKKQADTNHQSTKKHCIRLLSHSREQFFKPSIKSSQPPKKIHALRVRTCLHSR